MFIFADFINWWLLAKIAIAWFVGGAVISLVFCFLCSTD